MWVALDDVSEKNGCLFFMPGSHKDAELGRVAGGFGNMNKIFEDCAFAPFYAVHDRDRCTHANVRSDDRHRT